MHSGAPGPFSPGKGRTIRRWLARLALGLGFALATVLAYRTIFVYQILPIPCPPTPARPAKAAVEAIPSGARLSVLSYNVEGHAALVSDEHLAEIAAAIRARRPDVVALQEVHRDTWQSRFRDQAAELATRTGLRAVYGPSFHALGGDFGNALLTKWPVRAWRVVPLPSLGEPRSLLAATVEVRGARFDVYVTHLAAWGSLNSRIRGRQAECIATHLSAGRPFVLAGDLNAVPFAVELHPLMRPGFARLCGPLTEPTHALLARRLDYVMAHPRFRVLESMVLRTGPSDHWPVAATLAWQGDTP